MGEYILRLLVLVPMIGGLAWGCLWMWKRIQIGLPRADRAESRVRIAEVVPLGVGARLAVVEFAGRELLVAISKADIRLIADSDG